MNLPVARETELKPSAVPNIDRVARGRLRFLASLALVLFYSCLLGFGWSSVPSQSAGVLFVDVTRQAGIDFHLTCGGPEKRYIMESLCGGIAFLDYDNDGWMDILLVQGSTLENRRAGKDPLLFHLYHNNHDGTFTDITEKTGLRRRGWGMGVAIGDYDNDGWEDIYITTLTGGALFHNNGNGTFTDVTSTAGVDDHGEWGTSAAFGDYDNDGRLDLYVANYVDLDLNHLPEFGSGPFCQYRGIPVSCGPRGLSGARDRLYHNNGDGTFTDVTEKLGIDPNSYYGLGVVWGDYNNDGGLDLYVANDSSPSLLYQNNGGGTFQEVGLTAGVSLDSDGREQAGMGVDFGDYDNDGWLDLTKTNFSDDNNNLYHNNHDGTFDDRAGPAGIAPLTYPFLGFGTRFFDFDNDGWKDIIVANGHVNPQVDGFPLGITYAERALLFHNLRSGRFEEIGQRSGPALKLRKVSRGLAVGDFENNGSPGVLISHLDDSPSLLRNESGNRKHWIRIKAVGAKSNRDGFGARVEVTVAGATQIDEVRANSSYLSASDPRLLFGLGNSSRVDRILIHWPSGTVDEIKDEAADQELVVEEGRGIIARRPQANIRKPMSAETSPRPR